MKRLFFLMILAICFTFDINGQNLVFLGDRSFPSSETYTLKSNTQGRGFGDLRIVFAREGNKGLLFLSSKIVPDVIIANDIIIYLNDGTVIVSEDKGMNDSVDGVATTAYYLSDEDIGKMKSSDIHTIRYEFKGTKITTFTYSGTFSASNKGKHKTDFTEVISNFFND